MSAEFPTWISQTLVQAKNQWRTFWRTPVAAFFTLGLPLFMLLLFNALFDGEVDTGAGGLISTSQFYTAGLAAFTAVSATYTNLVNIIPIRRDDGVLKRVRSTPTPPSAYIGGVVASAVAIAIIGTILMLALGVVLYDFQIEAAKLPAAILTYLVGLVSFSLLGLAIAGIVPNAPSAPAVANATILPLAFISNIFIPLQDPPQWLTFIGDLFPLKHFAESFSDAFNPFVEAPAFRWGSLAVMVLWGAAGALVAITKFQWEPSVRAKVRGRKSGRKQPEEIAA